MTMLFTPEDAALLIVLASFPDEPDLAEAGAGESDAR
jgi:hypothetical protein